MWFHVDQRSSNPIYLQLVHGVKEAVAKGVLVSGDKLPSVRELAGQITINHNTIAKAYQELEREGIIETLRGRGTFVAAREAKALGAEKRMLLKGMLEKMLVEAFHMQVGEEELLDLLNKTVREWYQERRGQS